MDEPTNQEMVARSIQQQVDLLANDLLARGIRPTPKAIASQVDAPLHRLSAALEDWARRLSQEKGAGMDPAPRGGIDFIAGVPRERGENLMSRAAQAAGNEAARRKAVARQLAHRHDLAKEIDRAEARLKRLEERRQIGERDPRLDEDLEKTRSRLLRMRDAQSSETTSPLWPDE